MDVFLAKTKLNKLQRKLQTDVICNNTEVMFDKLSEVQYCGQNNIVSHSKDVK